MSHFHQQSEARQSPRSFFRPSLLALATALTAAMLVMPLSVLAAGKGGGGGAAGGGAATGGGAAGGGGAAPAGPAENGNAGGENTSGGNGSEGNNKPGNNNAQGNNNNNQGNNNAKGNNNPQGQNPKEKDPKGLHPPTNPNAKPGTPGTINANDPFSGQAVEPQRGQNPAGKVIPGGAANSSPASEAEMVRAQADQFGLIAAPTADGGALAVNQVSAGSELAVAGMRNGDQIVAINGQPISNGSGLYQSLQGAVAGGGAAMITIRRGGALQTLTSDLSSLANGGRGSLGASADARDGNITMNQVTPGSAAAEAGLTVGDVVTDVNGKPVTNLAQWNEQLHEAMKGDEPLNLQVRRNGKLQDMKIDMRRHRPKGRSDRGSYATRVHDAARTLDGVRTDLNAFASQANGPVGQRALQALTDLNSLSKDLTQQPGETVQAFAARVQQAQQQVGSLQTELEGLVNEGAAGANPQLSNAVNQLRKFGGDLRSLGDEDRATARMDRVRTGLTDLRGSIRDFAQLETGGTPLQIQPALSQIDGMISGLGQLDDATPEQRQQRVDQLRQRIGTLRTDLDTMETNANPATRSAIDKTLDRLRRIERELPTTDASSDGESSATGAPRP